MDSVQISRQGIVTEEEIHNAPMTDRHRELILQHFERLTRAFYNDDFTNIIPRFSTKPTVCEQLARLTIVIRDYSHRHAQGEFEEDEVESMGADAIEAVLFVEGRLGTYHQPTFINPMLFGREQEIAALMQEVSAESADDVIELWNSPSPMAGWKVIPEGERVGEDVNWDRVLRRTASDNDIAYHAWKGAKVREAVGVVREIEEDLDGWLGKWPPYWAQHARTSLDQVHVLGSLIWPPAEVISSAIRPVLVPTLAEMSSKG